MLDCPDGHTLARARHPTNRNAAFSPVREDIVNPDLQPLPPHGDRAPNLAQEVHARSGP
jgi:hypothetical protein